MQQELPNSLGLAGVNDAYFLKTNGYEMKPAFGHCLFACQDVNDWSLASSNAVRTGQGFFDIQQTAAASR